jgi:protein-S-isoprenylcysteine O-methyltransferase Ste14
VPPRWPDSLRVVGILFILAAIAGFVWAGAHARRLVHRVPATAARRRAVEDGPYRLVRHPIYGAGLLFLFGYGLLDERPGDALRCRRSRSCGG